MKGADIYNKPVLSIYDKWVLGFSNKYAWRCPTNQILDFYNDHIGKRHLDVGVGTGYFLDKCKMRPNPRLTLVDLNSNSLQMAASRLQRYHPATYAADILKPLPLNYKFNSIALNYLLHCLPEDIISKSNIVFSNLKPLLDGVIFGTTILGEGPEHNLLARSLSRIYNSRGIFNNTGDNVWDLRKVMEENFRHSFVYTEGCVAFFWGSNH